MEQPDTGSSPGSWKGVTNSVATAISLKNGTPSGMTLMTDMDENWAAGYIDHLLEKKLIRKGQRLLNNDRSTESNRNTVLLFLGAYKIQLSNSSRVMPLK